jgi:hypothetical protein
MIRQPQRHYVPDVTRTLDTTARVRHAAHFA